MKKINIELKTNRDIDVEGLTNVILEYTSSLPVDEDSPEETVIESNHIKDFFQMNSLGDFSLIDELISYVATRNKKEDKRIEITVTNS